jgi:putative transposase
VAIEVDRSLLGSRVARVLDRLADVRGLPATTLLDNGPEFVSAAMDLCACTNGVILDFSRRGKPTDNAVIEAFNGRQDGVQ